MVDVLRKRGYITLGLDGFAEGRNCHFGEDIQSEEVVLISLLEVEDIECDTPIVTETVS
jgi:hypothetical protein